MSKLSKDALDIIDACRRAQAKVLSQTGVFSFDEALASVIALHEGGHLILVESDAPGHPGKLAIGLVPCLDGEALIEEFEELFAASCLLI